MAVSARAIENRRDLRRHLCLRFQRLRRIYRGVCTRGTIELNANEEHHQHDSNPFQNSKKSFHTPFRLLRHQTIVTLIAPAPISKTKYEAGVLTISRRP